MTQDAPSLQPSAAPSLGGSQSSDEILYVLLDDFADFEPAFLAPAIRCDERAVKARPRYVNRTLSPSTSGFVRSCGGFAVRVDYTPETMPDDYAALILVGGYGWQTPEAETVVPVVQAAREKGIVVGAICNAVSFLARHGFLNGVRHTGNGLDQLKLWGAGNYANEAGYVAAEAVRDQRLVTANGTGFLEFARELLLELENDAPETIDRFYQFHKRGFCAFCRAEE